MLKHIVDIKHSLRRTIGELKLPRIFMDTAGNDLMSQMRELRCIVMPVYEQLEQVQDVGEFKKVYVDVVRGGSFYTTIISPSYADQRVFVYSSLLGLHYVRDPTQGH